MQQRKVKTVVFNKAASKVDREEALELFKQIAAQPTNSTSKLLILTQVLEYAQENLVGYFTMSIDENRFIQVNNIFANAQLDDILFMQYVINTLSGIRDDNSKLRDTVLPNAIQYRDLLLEPTVKNIQKIAGGILLLAYFEPWVALPAIILLLAAHSIAVGRLETALANLQSKQLAKALNITGEAKIGDGLDNRLTRAASLGERAVTQVVDRTLNAAETVVQRLERGASASAALPAPAYQKRLGGSR